MCADCYLMPTSAKLMENSVNVDCHVQLSVSLLEPDVLMEVGHFSRGDVFIKLFPMLQMSLIGLMQLI